MVLLAVLGTTLANAFGIAGPRAIGTFVRLQSLQCCHDEKGPPLWDTVQKPINLP